MTGLVLVHSRRPVPSGPSRRPVVTATAGAPDSAPLDEWYAGTDVGQAIGFGAR